MAEHEQLTVDPSAAQPDEWSARIDDLPRRVLGWETAAGHLRSRRNPRQDGSVYTATSGLDDGPTVLLLHGGGVAGWMWDSLRKHLEPTHAVLVPDLPGHGQSADEAYVPHSATVDALVGSLSGVPGRPAAVVGFSLGAQLAIELASEHPQLVDQLVLVSAQTKEMPLSTLALRALAVTAPLARRRWFAKLQARALFIPPHLLEHYVSTSAGITKQTLLAAVGSNLEFELPVRWSSFPGRVLVMAGADERRMMRESAATIKHSLPSSELEIVRGCGHGIPLKHPAWFDERVSAWLARS